MRYQPLRDKAKGAKRVSQSVQIPAPTKGWYSGANLAEAPPGSAFLLQNAFPQLDYVRVRRGCQAWATGMPNAAVQTIMPWQFAGASKMFAACNTSIYDVSSGGAVGAAVVTGLSNATFQYVQFQGISGSYLIAVNGADSVKIFDGTGWNRTVTVTGTTTSGSKIVTGITPNTSSLLAGMYVTGTGIAANSFVQSVDSSSQVTLTVNATANGTVSLTFAYTQPITGNTNAFSNVSIFKNRLYFVENNTLNVWYMPVQTIGGAATLFPLQGIFRLGGYIVATATWAIDSTSGIYESFIVLTSEGEVAMYAGSYPGDAAWELKGLYKVSRPLGKRCVEKAGGDLMIMTEDGIVPMSKVQELDQIALQNVAVTMPIQPSWRQAVLDRVGQTGWQITLWPLESMGVINLPKASTTDKTQFVVNARTGAWCQYSGWDANCFAVWNGSLYFGSSDGRVMQGEVGSADDGGNYTATIFPSYHQLSGKVTHKQVKMIHQYAVSNFSGYFTPTVKVDYATDIPNAPSSLAPSSSGAIWDSSTWDFSTWGGAPTTQGNWEGAYGFGNVFSVVLQCTLSSSSVTPDIRLMRTDILFEEANIIA